ncbi:ABC transporter permease [Clostridium sp. C105KSO13]|uniref:ABC transporter permease n=1 Tax=Clostridium sp. C105KSO13 TaxID=1776045 RepID=UPI0007405E37|nr:ABC transporter permease [Clostridium sp. C105KSO13]CUX31399.1 FtsX-like permease family protein [Clostridium sp. C105KSO13]
MIKVSNRKCIRNLSARSLKASKTRNLIAILAIVLTTIMFTALFTIAASINYSFQQENFRMVGGDGHGSFKDISEEQMEKLRQDPLIKESGGRLFLGMTEGEPFQKAHVEVSYIEPGEVPHYFCEPKEGKLPKEGTNQAATDTRVLELLGVKPEVGTKFTMTYNLGSGTGEETPVTKAFELSGWWEYDEAATASHVLVPLSCAKKELSNYQPQDKSNQTGKWTLDVFFKNARHIEENMRQVLKDNGYQCDDGSKDNFIDIGVNWGYTGAQFSQKADPVTVFAIVALLVLIIFTGYLIIYNVFQISVANDIQFYGLLKTIGTTGRQISRMIRFQALALAGLGIPVGLLLGFLIGTKLTPVIMEQLSYKVALVSYNPLIFLGAIIFAVITVLLSCRRPGKIAARVSPIEAVRYAEGGREKRRKVRKKGREKPSLFSMAWANLGRNRKKTVLVIVSLSLAVVLLNIAVMFTNGFDMDKYLQSKVVTDFVVGSADYFNTTNAGFRDSGQAITEDVILDINSRKGMKESGRIYGQTSSVEQLMTETEYRKIYRRWGENKKTVDKRVQWADKSEDGRIYEGAQFYGMESLPLGCLGVIDGDLSSLSDSDSHSIAAVYMADDYGKVEKDSHWAKTGDIVKIRYVDEYEYYDTDTGKILSEKETDNYSGNYNIRAAKYHEEEYRVAATVTVPNTESYRYYGRQEYVMGADAFRRDSGTSDVMTYLFNMDSQTSTAGMSKFLEHYTNKVQTSYDYESKMSYVKEFDGFQNMFSIMGGVLSGIVALVGILNFFNAILTGIITRKREFAVLQSIGMTGRQLKQMLMIEGLIYTLAAILVSLIFSLILSPLIGSMLTNMFWFFTFRQTELPILLIVPVFAILGLVIPLLTYHSAAKHTIVERLRDTET